MHTSMGNSSDELRVPTHAVAVHLLRAGCEPERAELFVIDAPRGRGAAATEVAALLEGGSPFVPVREPDAPGGPRVALVGKQAIIWVAVRLGDESELGAEPSEMLALYDQRHDVRVELAGIDPIAGHILYSSPADRPRLADHLNQPDVHFLRVWTTHSLYLVNKHHIVRVVETT
jgi:hypothetical protein